MPVWTILAGRSRFELIVNPRGTGRIHVDQQADPVVFLCELDHYAALGGAIQIGYGERAAAVEHSQDSLQLCALGLIDEKNLAPADILRIAEAAYHQFVSFDTFSQYRFFQLGGERIAAQHTDHKGLGRRCKCRCRPFDEMGEVVDEDCLDLVLRRCAGSRREAGRRQADCKQAREQQSTDRVHRRHANFAKMLRCTSVRAGSGNPYSG